MSTDKSEPYPATQEVLRALVRGCDEETKRIRASTRSIRVLRSQQACQKARTLLPDLTQGVLKRIEQGWPGCVGPDIQSLARTAYHFGLWKSANYGKTLRRVRALLAASLYRNSCLGAGERRQFDGTERIPSINRVRFRAEAWLICLNTPRGIVPAELLEFVAGIETEAEQALKEADTEIEVELERTPLGRFIYRQFWLRAPSGVLWKWMGSREGAGPSISKEALQVPSSRYVS